MSDHVRLQPIARYRIVQRHGNGQGTIEYADDHESALQHATDVSGGMLVGIEVVIEFYDGHTWQVVERIINR